MRWDGPGAQKGKDATALGTLELGRLERTPPSYMRLCQAYQQPTGMQPVPKHASSVPSLHRIDFAGQSNDRLLGSHRKSV